MTAGPGSGAGRWIAFVLASLAMALAVVLVVGYARVAGDTGRAEAAERVDTAAGGVPITAVAAFGVPAAAGQPLDPFRSSADGDRVVAAVLADLADFWSVWPAGGVVSMNGLAESGRALCIGDPAHVLGNTFYCAAGDGIVYDSAALVPVLLGAYGSAGLAASFAHEFGHAVQARSGPTPAQRAADPRRYPAILVEAQADCAAGAFLAAAAAGSTDRVHVPPESLVRAVAPLLDFRDPPTVSPADATAHGLGLDRLGFVLRGLREGGSCWAITADELTEGPLALTLGRSGTVTDPLATPRFDSAAAAVAAADASVSAFAGGPAAAPDPADLDRSSVLGQFAVAAAVARATGLAHYGDPAGAACFTGAWTASVFGSARAGELGSWAGDADEALDLIRSRPGATFAELAAYSDGFHGSRAACG